MIRTNRNHFMNAEQGVVMRLKMKSSIMGMLGAFLILMMFMCSTAYADEKDTKKIDNGIPVMYITIDETQGSIEAMNKSKDHSVYCHGTVSIDVPDGFHYCDMKDADCSDLPETEMDIKGRGNTTWGEDKKPYKIKLKKAADVFGLGKNKHWVLLANALDKTLIKNRITAWLGDKIGLPYTPRGVPVDLVMRNTAGTYEEYLGSYYLSEQVRVGNNRIEIDELEAGDTAKDVISGGYLVQNGSQTDEKSPSYFTTKSGALWANHTPNFDPDDGGYKNDAQKKYIRGYMQEVEDAINSADFEGKKQTSYRKLMDLESAAKYWLVMEASKNGDSYGTGSTYLYKKRGGKLYWGPLWDFDYSWYYLSGYNGFEVRHEWLYGMFNDRGKGGFIEEVKKQWPAVKKALLQIAADKTGLIDLYYAETKKSQEQDLIKYPARPPEKGGRKFDPAEDKELFKRWIKNRVSWMDQHMKDLDHMVHMVTAEADGTVTERRFVQDGYPFIEMLSPPEKEGYLFLGWQDKEGRNLNADTQCTEDITVHAKFVLEKEATKAKKIFFRRKDDYLPFREDIPFYQVYYQTVPENAEDSRITWSVSDDDILSIDDEGGCSVHKPGDVRITAALSSGISETMTLHITAEDLPFPDSIKTEKAVYELAADDYAHIDLITAPVKAYISMYEYTSSNTKAAQVDDIGTIKAIAPGRTTITVTATCFDEKYNQITREAKCEVIVKAPNPMKVKGKKATVRYRKLKKRNQKLTVRKVLTFRKKGKGKMTYKLSSAKKGKKSYKKHFKINTKTGRITVKKGLRRGTYNLKIKVKAAGNTKYSSAVKTVTCKIRIR